MLLGWRKTQQASGLRYFNALQVIIGGLTVVSLGMLFLAVEQGLLGSPDMQIIGNQSSAFNLNWYQDRSPATLPIATLISVPLIVYRVLMLALVAMAGRVIAQLAEMGLGVFFKQRALA